MTQTTTADPSLTQLKEKGLQLKDQVGEIAGIAKNLAGQKLAELKDSANSFKQTSMEKLGKFKDGTCDYVRENPVKCVIVAVGIGALAGALLARRR